MRWRRESQTNGALYDIVSCAILRILACIPAMNLRPFNCCQPTIVKWDTLQANCVGFEQTTVDI